MQRFASLAQRTSSSLLRSLPSWTASSALPRSAALPRGVALQSTAAAASAPKAGALGQINDMLVRGKDGAGAW